jgi:hypothetical protein
MYKQQVLERLDSVTPMALLLVKAFSVGSALDYLALLAKEG